MIGKVTHIIELNNLYYQKKFTILAYFFSGLGYVDYRVFNIIIQHYFIGNGSVIYGDMYEKYFLKNKGILMEISEDDSFLRIRTINDKPGWISQFSEDIELLEYQYNKLIRLNINVLNRIYFHSL